jgi:streptogramin lyase
VKYAIAVILALGFTCSLATAAIPPPGQHSAHPKYWATLHRWVTNYSPLQFEGSIAAIASDGGRGVWFGQEYRLYHLDSHERISEIDMPEYLWEVDGFARDPSGRLWFALGQSGRIGTLDERARVRTRVVVPRRFFPDIRDIAFAADGTLWFRDFGRRSIGRLSPDGNLLEVPIDDAYASRLMVCGARVYVVDESPYVNGPEQFSLRNSTTLRTIAVDASDPPPVCRASGWSSFRGSYLERRDDATSAIQVFHLQIGANIDGVARSPNGDLWLALNMGNVPLAITRLSARP